MTDRDHDPIPHESASNGGGAAGDDPAMTRDDDERTSMTDDERRAFERGYEFAIEQAIEATDGLLGVAVEYAGRLAWAAEREDEPDLRPVAVRADAAIWASMHALRRLRYTGALDALRIAQIEDALSEVPDGA